MPHEESRDFTHTHFWQLLASVGCKTMLYNGIHKKFNFQVNREKQALEVDEELDSIELEELQDILPSHQPRFIVYRYVLYYIQDTY